ncbi:uncharacterized protein LOC122252846 isoform X2 [Penaeus japonicus]|uniref:uncharacterized protein LOC122252846 isoform X2 n=1 Tax=Penaeus japonicus TaxID=27405 RepID=UPI001C716A5A|nr:uncharacterized protein LOC122252846 isoform X2 [Penaeus japonicus]
MQKKRSAVWRHFQEVGENKVACRTCHKHLTKHGNTSMMLRHLRGKHPELTHCLLEADGAAVSDETITWQIEEQPVEEVVEAIPIYEGQAFKKKRSTVWRHFTEEGTDKVSCSICHEKLAKHGNTSSMLRHLRGKHPQLKLGELQGDRKYNRLHLKASNTETRFLSVCERLLQHNQLTDCTLMADGQFVQAHRLVLATCSDSFEELFKTVTHANPVVVLRDMTIQELRGILNYMYKGETLVKSHELPGLLKAAAQLKIKGLSQVGLADSWMDAARTGQEHHMTGAGATKQDLAFYDPDLEDEEEDDLEDEEEDHQLDQSAQRKRSAQAYELMAMCEDVDLDTSHRSNLSQQDSVQPLKRVQIKLETGTDMSDSEDQEVVDLQQQEDDENNVTHFIPMQEEVIIHEEDMDMHDDEQDTNQAETVTIVAEDPLSQAVKDDEGMILLGLAEGGSQSRIYTTAGSSLGASTSRSTRPEPPRSVRKFAKQDLVTALNLVQDGHLGIKPAAKAFNIPIATLYNASKRQSTNAIEQQTVKSTVFRKKQL